MNKINNIYIFLTLLGGFVMTSCSNFLEIQPTGKVIPNTLEEYRALMTKAYYQEFVDKSMCDMRTADITITDDELDQSDYGDIEKWIPNSTIAKEFGWADYYENIYYANAIIHNQGEIIDGSKEDVNQLVGEAYFMRGYMHFLLVNMYGEPYTKENALNTKAVPLKLSLDLEEIPTRSTVNEVYSSILSDIDNARKLITKKEWETGYNYRFSALAIDAFLSRLKLYMGEWEESYDAAERALAQKSTLENFNNEGLILPNEYNSVESITAFEKIYGETTTLKASHATPSFKEMYDDNDLRTAKYFGKMDEKGNYEISKATGLSKSKCSFRVGELYLNSAESAARRNNLTDARKRLLQLMENRYTPAGYIQKQAEINNMNQAALITEILNERARELAFEGHRWFDLRRTTRPRIEKVINSGQTIILEQDDPRYTLRIPQSAINVNPGLMN